MNTKACSFSTIQRFSVECWSLKTILQQYSPKKQYKINSNSKLLIPAPYKDIIWIKELKSMVLETISTKKCNLRRKDIEIEKMTHIWMVMKFKTKTRNLAHWIILQMQMWMLMHLQFPLQDTTQQSILRNKLSKVAKQVMLLRLTMMKRKVDCWSCQTLRKTQNDDNQFILSQLSWGRQ